MVINRRCTPYYDLNGDYGGGRYIKILLDPESNDFSGFNNWKITKVENDSIIGTFDKRNIVQINLGWFMPGEGRLYKIAPVM